MNVRTLPLYFTSCLCVASLNRVRSVKNIRTALVATMVQTTSALSTKTATPQESSKHLAETIQSKLRATADPKIKERSTKAHKYLLFLGHQKPSLLSITEGAVADLVTSTSNTAMRNSRRVETRNSRTGNTKTVPRNSKVDSSLDLQTQKILLCTSELLMRSEIADDKLCGIILLQHTLIDHHLRCVKQIETSAAQQQKHKPLHDDDSETSSYNNTTSLSDVSIFADAVDIIRRIEILIDDNCLNSWIFIDAISTGVFRKLIWSTNCKEDLLRTYIIPWSKTECRPIENMSSAESTVYRDAAVWKRRVPLVTCVVPAMHNEFEFTDVVSNNDSTQNIAIKQLPSRKSKEGAMKKRKRGSVVEREHPIDKSTPQADLIGDMLLDACSDNIRLGHGERFASTGAGWFIRYVYKHHPNIAINWMNDNVHMLTPEGVRYALEQCTITDEDRKALRRRALKG